MYDLTICVVGTETLEVTDSDSGMTHLEMDTLRLTLFLLRTYTTADSRQRRRLFDDRCSSEDVTRFEGLNKARDVDVHRTTLYAGRVLTVETAMGLRDRLVKGKTLVYFLVQGLDAHFGTKFRHLYTGNRHAVLGGTGEGFNLNLTSIYYRDTTDPILSR